MLMSVSCAGLRRACVTGTLIACFSVGGCQPQAAKNTDALSDAGATEPTASTAQTAPLPLRVPILAVMLGSINRSSNDVFQAAASGKNLADDDWLRLGEAAVGLMGDATLITVAGTGPKDAAWVADPKWMRLSIEMQAASFAVGRAADTKDPAALTEATARLAQSCQACHLEFSPHLVTSPPEAEAPPADR